MKNSGMNQVTGLNSLSRGERLSPSDVEPESLLAVGGTSFEPIRLVEAEISRPLSRLSAVDPRNRRRYRRVLALVRLHGEPLGFAPLSLGEGDLSPQEYADQIWRALRDEINSHLRRDGLPEMTGLDAAGLPDYGTPLCLREREARLAGAPFASIVVATRDRPESLATCLHSLLALDYPNYEIIVVDNAPSTQATADLIERMSRTSPRLRYVREDQPGCSYARTRGLLEARAEIVVFTDDDVVVDRQWLANLVQAFEVADNVGCVTGMILPMELETPAQKWIEQYGGFSKGFRRRLYDLGENRPDNPLYPYTAGMFGSGANMAFKASVLRAIGGFDPALGSGSPALGGEDLAAYFQVLMAGYRLVYEPSAILRHSHRRDEDGLRSQIYSYGVGLTAYLTKCLFDNPRLLPGFIARIPSGLRFLFSPSSPKNIKKRSGYPKELNKLELKGMLRGPFAYLQGRRRRQRAASLTGPGRGVDYRRAAAQPTHPSG